MTDSRILGALSVGDAGARHFRSSDLGGMVALLARLGKGAGAPGEREFIDLFVRPEDGRDPTQDLVVVAAPDGRILGFAALYRDDEFFSAMGPFLDPGLGEDMHRAAHALLNLLEREARNRDWDEVRFEVEGTSRQRLTLLHHRGYREVRVFRRLARMLESVPLQICLGPGAETLDSFASRMGEEPSRVLGSLMDKIFAHTWMYRAHGEPGAAQRLGRQGAGAGRVLLAIDELYDRPQGFLEWSAPGTGQEAFIDELGVLASGRRQGLGGRLLSTGLAEIRRSGARVVGLDVDQSNRAARALYERAGFEEVGRIRYLSCWVQGGRT